MAAGSARAVFGPLVKLTVFVVVTVVLTAALVLVIASTSFGAKATYHAQFTDVAGLNDGDDVRIAGVKVGTVAGIEVKPRPGRAPIADVSLSLDVDQRLPLGMRAKVRYRNLIGTRYVALTDGPGPVGDMKPDDVIPLSRTAPALDLTVLFNGFKPLFAALNPSDVNKVAFEIIQVLQGEGGTIAGLLSRTGALTTTLANRDQLIGQVITNLNQILGTVASRTPELDNLILQLQRTVTGLAGDRVAIGESLANISLLTGSTADLLTEGRPALKADIASLRRVAGTLNANSAVVDGVLQRLPGKLNALTATGYSGSWFNFYLCDIGGTAKLPGLDPIKVGPISRGGYPCTGGA